MLKIIEMTRESSSPGMSCLSDLMLTLLIKVALIEFLDVKFVYTLIMKVSCVTEGKIRLRFSENWHHHAYKSKGVTTHHRHSTPLPPNK